MPLSPKQLADTLLFAREKESEDVATFMRAVVHRSLGRTSVRVLQLIESRWACGEVTTSRHICKELELEQNHAGNILMDLLNLGLVFRSLVLDFPGSYYEYEPFY